MEISSLHWQVYSLSVFLFYQYISIFQIACIIWQPPWNWINFNLFLPKNRLMWPCFQKRKSMNFAKKCKSKGHLGRKRMFHHCPPPSQRNGTVFLALIQLTTFLIPEKNTGKSKVFFLSSTPLVKWCWTGR